MNRLFKTSFLLCSFLLAGPVLAGPPMKVVYADKVTTSLKWHWPLQTRKKTDYQQSKPYYYTSRLIQKYAGENVSKYRHYYQQRAGKNDWGYYFDKGTKLSPRMVIQFGPPEPQNRVRWVASPRM